jgi:hypothetical protein
MRFQVLTAVKISGLVIWVVMPCGLVVLWRNILPPSFGLKVIPTQKESSHLLSEHPTSL